MTIKKHVSHCETMNGYISLLPTLRDSSLAVTSTEKGNVPFNEATLASILLATCHINWRNLYELNHKTFTELTRSMLHNLETIEKVFVEKNNEKAKANIAKAGTAPRKGLSVPRKKRKGGVQEDQPLRRHAPPITASIARRWVGPIRLTTPAIVVGLTRTAKRQASLISPSLPRRSPGKRTVMTQDRWLI